MVGSRGTSHIQSWELRPKMGVPDLRKTNRTRPPTLGVELIEMVQYTYTYSPKRNRTSDSGKEDNYVSDDQNISARASDVYIYSSQMTAQIKKLN
jgi:hypothetical protein